MMLDSDPKLSEVNALSDMCDGIVDNYRPADEKHGRNSLAAFPLAALTFPV